MGDGQVQQPTTVNLSERVLSVVVYLVALACWTLVLGLPKQTLSIFLWIWLATIAWNVRAPLRAQLAFPRDWWPFLAVLTLYVYSRGLADQLGFVNVHVTEPINADRWLFGGTLPTAWLQATLCGSPCFRTSSPAWYDVLLTTVYYSYFFAPLIAASVLWLRDRRRWMGFMRRYVTLCVVALVGYITYPMAPPWMAVRDGYLSVNIDRITSRGWFDLGEVGLHQSVSTFSNQVAAMPSLHAGTALLLALFGVTQLRSPWRWLLLLYPLSMGFALVYFAEHYVVDILAGFASAGLVMWGCALWEHWRSQIPKAPAPRPARRARPTGAYSHHPDRRSRPGVAPDARGPGEP